MVGNTQHRYRVIRLWEQDSTPLLATPALLPFAALARIDSSAALLQQIAADGIDMIEELDEQRNISACVEVRLCVNLQFIKKLFNRVCNRESRTL